MPNCNKCGLPIGFKKQDNGNWRPVNPDGSDHFDDCSHELWKQSGGVQYKNIGHTVGSGFKKKFDPSDESVPWDEK